jgi:hypothetical protein
LLNPWSPGSTANLIWAVCWGGVGFTLHVLHPTWIRGAKYSRGNYPRGQGVGGIACLCGAE